MVAMGMSEDAAQKLIDTVLKTPKTAKTEYSSNANSESRKVDALGNKIVSLPDGSFQVVANTSGAYRNLMKLQSLLRTVTGNKSLHISTGIGGQGGLTMHDGGVVVPMASGGSLTPMAPVAQAVPPNTWRVVGDRMKDREFYIPDDNSERSRSVLLEAMRSFGMLPMSEGGVVSPSSAASSVRPIEVTFNMPPGLDADEFARAVRADLATVMRGA